MPKGLCIDIYFLLMLMAAKSNKYDTKHWLQKIPPVGDHFMNPLCPMEQMTYIIWLQEDTGEQHWMKWVTLEETLYLFFLFSMLRG